MSNIIISPKYLELKEKIEKLKVELSMKVSELDQLRFVECENIKMDYMMKLGDLEYNLFKYECKYLRLKRKTVLIQAKINRQEYIDIENIDRILDKEFEEYINILNDKWKDINSALNRYHSKTLSIEDTHEIKALYRQIVKALHPDINPNISEKELTLFSQAVEAYRCGDLEGIRVIFNLLDQESLDIKYPDTIEALEDMLDNLNNSINNINDNINFIKSSYPYNTKDLLNNEELLKQKKDKYQKDIDEYLKGIANLENNIDLLIKNNKGDNICLA